MKTLLGLLITTLTLTAHESPIHSIQHLTEHINRSPSAQLHAARAQKFQQVGQLQKAIADLEISHRLDPSNPTYPTHLASILHQTKQPALPTLTRALSLAKSVDDKTSALNLRAKIHLDAGNPELAEPDITRALKLHPAPPADWFLTQAKINLELDQLEKRATDLENAIKRNSNAALLIAWIEALIDSNQAPKALPIIQRELNDSRHKSAWLIRRAKAYRSLNAPQKATSDLDQAIKLLNQRINPANPNSHLASQLRKAKALRESLSHAETP